MAGNRRRLVADAARAAAEVMQLALDPEVSAMRIAAVVSKDQVLSADVIRLANSAFSASATAITGVREAVVRMRTTAVCNVVVSQCLASRLKDSRIYGGDGRKMTDRSIGTAYLARLVADQAIEPPDEAFLYGLLHDIGKLVILTLARDPRHDHHGPAPDNEAIDALMVEKHAEFSGYLLQHWKLPEHLDDPIIWHHHPDRAGQSPRAAAVAYTANRLAHRYGFGCSADEFDPLSDPVCAAVGIDEQSLADIDAHAPGLFEVARQIVR